MCPVSTQRPQLQTRRHTDTIFQEVRIQHGQTSISVRGCIAMILRPAFQKGLEFRVGFCVGSSTRRVKCAEYRPRVPVFPVRKAFSLERKTGTAVGLFGDRPS